MEWKDIFGRVISAGGRMDVRRPCGREKNSLAMLGMAAVYSDRNWKIKIYPDDHAPPHFQVQTPDGESLVEIDGLQVLGKGANPKALKAALAWATSHKAELQRVWNEQSRRH
ncbi:DUF4160 domain-containing protein [Pseudomonas sp. NR3]|uniref:DUF4160 domain-containing protein n=1 Tax=Pseudomonas sp. NR3 TaxID=3155978 RepID=UPI003B67DD88